jgi:hypothetical protein
MGKPRETKKAAAAATAAKEAIKEAALEEAAKEAAAKELVKKAAAKAACEVLLDILEMLGINPRMNRGPLDFTGEYPSTLRMDALRGNPHLVHTRVMGIGIPIGTLIGEVSIPEFLQKEIPAEVVDYLGNNAADINVVVVENGKATVHKKDGTVVIISPSNDKSDGAVPSKPNDTSGKNTPSDNAFGDVPRPITGVIPDDDDDDVPGP